MFPSQRDAIRELARQLPPQRQRAAIGAVYESRAHPGFVVAARHLQSWSGPFHLDRLPEHPFTVGMLGGGFTLWLKQCWKLYLTGMQSGGQNGLVFGCNA